MKVAKLYAQEDLRIEDAPEPAPGRGEVKIRNAYTGICGSDLHLFYAPESVGMDFHTPHPVTGSTFPQILGHEFSGTVSELGEGVTDVEIGDRVAVWPIYFCGTCAACRKGRYNICTKIGFHGVTSRGGGMAEFTTVPATMIHKLPDNVDLRMGALVEPMAVGWNAAGRSGIQTGGTALIAGAGPIGIGVWFALRARGIENILVSEPNPDRRASIAALGATVINPATDDLATAVADMSGGDGVDVAFDAAGAGPAITSALANLTPGGRVVIVALHERPAEFSATALVTAETEIVGAVAYLPEDFDAVIGAMAAGFYDTTGWVDDIDLVEVVDAIRALHAGTGAKLLIKQ